MFSDKEFLQRIVGRLCDEASYAQLYHYAYRDVPMPSVTELEDILELLRGVLFPGYFGSSEVNAVTMPFYIGSTVTEIYKRLTEQVKRGFCFDCSGEQKVCGDCERKAIHVVKQFLEMLPDIRRFLATDVEAAYYGDPAAKNKGETIFCYPSILALFHHRVAHALLKLGVPLIPRIISEMAHSKTGIDIHPGATIGEYFFIDHGTGTVIGETCIIGKNVRLYQGVTLGAKSFPKDEYGNPIKGIPRHPIVEDDVIIYSGATVLGRITIGRGAVIGGNVWVTEDVPAGQKILQTQPRDVTFDQGAGI
ncbi:serine O-acetyltransferase EpsC [Thermospira aquatica]|uniref:serine O-acetyltransferase n=1 Tax=Thermospira aquatica TaxID=2828656 RepID=A0AAX3BBI2_9SPIR|nr:serine O-acetyltransferase EpsC [Thermospira aquatica]URA09652.1 serine acetyltransferase [Thermospira aquatica]